MGGGCKVSAAGVEWDVNNLIRLAGPVFFTPRPHLPLSLSLFYLSSQISSSRPGSMERDKQNYRNKRLGLRESCVKKCEVCREPLVPGQ